MTWNWQKPEWPHFVWDQNKLVRAERLFLEETSMASGAALHLTTEDKAALTVELMTGNAVDTSEIEGEALDRQSVQSSIQRQFGFKTQRKQATPAERGIAELTVDTFRNYATPLTSETLFSWHALVMGGRFDLDTVGGYRDHAEPMQIVSGLGRKRRVHFEAPPSEKVAEETERLMRWFNQSDPKTATPPLPILARAGIVHLWFESIHPFEDGNGRIGRVLAEKALMQGMSNPTVTALSTTLLRRRKEYYHALEKANVDLEITDWLLWFASAAIEAERSCRSQVEFLIAKTKLLDSLRGKINARQEKALLRLFAAGPGGFVGGLSAKNYATITGAPSATVTRDLVDLVHKGALKKTGERKTTRYFLHIEIAPATKVSIADIL